MARAVFVDFATVDAGDLDTGPLRRVLPDLTLHASTRQDELDARIAGAQIVLVNKIRIGRETMARHRDSLRLIGLTATGTNNIDLDAAREFGIGVRNIRDYCTPSVTQHVLGVILALTHRFFDYHRAATGGAWAASPQFTVLDYPIRELRDRVLGVVGWGVLGQAVARACQDALGMRVLIANRPGGTREAGRLDLRELLPRADVLTLHCPLTPATTGLIGASELALMKPEALLVNTARGALIDIPALADALRARRLGGAAIDVLPEEPPRNGSPLFDSSLPNLIVTPHTAWAARESRQRCLDEIAANLADALAGGQRGRVA